jgi:hypothetical protein
LQWNINRWYDSKVGRWMSEDPIGFEGVDRNLYRYVHGVLLAKIDVFGLYEDCTIKIHVGHGAPGAEATAASVRSEGKGATGFGKVSAISCALGTVATTGQDDINMHLAALAYNVPSNLPELPQYLQEFPLDETLLIPLFLNQNSFENSNYLGTKDTGVLKKPAPISGLITQTQIDSLWPVSGSFGSSHSDANHRRAYNNAAATIFKVYLLVIYKEGLNMSKDSKCVCGTGGKATITFMFKGTTVISRANFIKGVWNKPVADWTVGMAGVNYEHKIESGVLKIVVNRHGTAGSVPPPELTHATW